MTSPVNYQKFPLDTIVFKPPVKNSRGGQTVYIDTSANNRSNPHFSLEKCMAPFGLNLTDHTGEVVVGRKNLELELSSPELLAWLRAFDERVIDHASKNSELLFKRKLSADTLRERYMPAVREDAEGKYAPKLRIKIDPPDYSKPTAVYIVEKDKEGGERFHRGKEEEIVPGSSVVANVELKSMWFISSGFGVTFAATHVCVWPAGKTEVEFPFDLPIPKRSDTSKETAPVVRAETVEPPPGGGDIVEGQGTPSNGAAAPSESPSENFI